MLEEKIILNKKMDESELKKFTDTFITGKLKCIVCNDFNFILIPDEVGLVSKNNGTKVSAPKPGETSTIPLNVDFVYRVICQNCGFTYMFSFSEKIKFLKK